MTAEELAADLDVPVRTVRALLGDFEAAGLIAPRGDDKLDGFQLGRAAESITVAQLLTALRGSAETALRRVADDPPLCELFEELNGELGRLLRERTLAQLAKGEARRGVDRARSAG
jgi:DNA-binding IscR family transcriptional regulator